MFNLFRRQNSYKDLPNEQLMLKVHANRCSANHRCPVVKICPADAII